MDMLFIILGAILVLLFFLYIKNAAEILCRIVGGFSLLIIYNALAMKFSIPVVGINLFSSLTTGLLGAPGGALLILCATFF